MTAEALQKQVVAVIDIGSSAIRMVVAEIGPKTEVRYLERLQKAVPFGKDVFTSGRLSQGVMRDGITILKNFKTVLEGYGNAKVHAIATSAVRDAANRDTFVDQTFVRTGIDVEVIEGAEENRLELIAVEQALGDKFDYQKKSCLIVEVGSGSTEMIILNQGEVELTRTLSLGSIRLPEQAVAGKTSAAVMQRVLKRNIHDIAQYAGREYSLGEIDTFIALGGDMRFAVRQLVPELDQNFAILESKPFLDFTSSLAKMSVEETADRYGLAYPEAETLYPALLYYAYFMGETKAERIVVPMMSIRDGLVLELAQLFSGYKRTDVSKQVASSARRLAKKYKYDEPHATAVSSLALKLFDALKDQHGLGTRERLLLEVAGILHEVGMFISQSGYHRHSSYLIDAAEIFGLRKTDKTLVSNVVRFHRGAPPHTQESYVSLSRGDRAVVAKLSALLRVAASLDESRQQKIRTFQLETNDDNYALWVPEDLGDISIEREALAKRGLMFTEVFGAGLALKQGSPPK